ncbi:hypothetical protein JR316_0005512 [Psilocybe cubensis]|uniref:Uncharacterized protein n=2 Tax=Psilocybe cubensis TaxID=181762 RepID=A0A8H8CM74_PSICU|nr:hypothetical protein JR316_0005512 [Psilocybe cubensis]KAH9480994.1 hypothetical protein JR316_0005512 [Psilocybe cubensis]
MEESTRKRGDQTPKGGVSTLSHSQNPALRDDSKKAFSYHLDPSLIFASEPLTVFSMSQSNIFNFSNILLSQSESEGTSTTDSCREHLDAFHGFEGGINELLLPSVFQEYYMPEQDIQVFNSIPQTHGGNDNLQEGLLSLDNAALDVVYHSAAPGVPSAVPYTSQDLAQIWDSDFSSLNEYLVNPTEGVLNTASYRTPAAMTMSSSTNEAPHAVYSDFAHRAYGESSGLHFSSMSRNEFQRPVNTFEPEHKTQLSRNPVLMTPFPRCLSVGPSRQPRGMSHHTYTPYSLIETQHNPASHHIECAPNLQSNPTWRIPPSGEMINQISMSEQGQFQGVEGSGIIPVEQTSKGASGSRNARRSEPQQEQGNRRVAPKRGPRVVHRAFVRKVRIDRVTGKPVYQGMRPDTKQQTENTSDSCNS